MRKFFRFCVRQRRGLMLVIMKTIMLGLMIMGLASAALAIEPAELDHRIREF